MVTYKDKILKTKKQGGAFFFVQDKKNVNHESTIWIVFVIFVDIDTGVYLSYPSVFVLPMHLQIKEHKPPRLDAWPK